MKIESVKHVQPVGTAEARCCWIAIIAIAIFGDWAARRTKGCTLSEYLRKQDYASGGWLRYVLIGFVCHIIAPVPWGGWTKSAEGK